MPSLNLVQIIGNTGKDPEMRFTPSGNAVVTFPVAVSHNYTDPSGERKQETEWFSVVAWNKTAELCNQYITKGQSVYIQGRIKTRSWVSDDGNKHYRTELIANRVLFLEKKQASNGAGDEEQVSPENPTSPSDIPF